MNITEPQEFKRDIFLSATPQTNQWIVYYEGAYVGNFNLFIDAVEGHNAAREANTE
jgi:hypothetical protein